jgi:hypothetical protein
VSMRVWATVISAVYFCVRVGRWALLQTPSRRLRGSLLIQDLTEHRSGSDRWPSEAAAVTFDRQHWDDNAFRFCGTKRNAPRWLPIADSG